MSLSDIAKQVGRSRDSSNGSGASDDDLMDIIEFVESPYGLGFSKELCGKGLYPVQKFILKMFYNLPLEEDDKVIRIPRSWRDVGSTAPGSNFEFTEQEYLEYLYSNGRCNIKKQGRDRKELVLPIGRRSGKSFMSSVIASFETYKLIKRYNPQAYYGVPDGTQVQVCSIATSKDQAGMLYKEIRRLVNSCDFLKKWMERETQTMAEFHTPYDLDVDNKPSIRTTFYSSSAKGVRGSANIIAIMDEVAFFKTTGQSSAKEVYQALSPSLAQFSPKDPLDASKPIGDSDGRMIMISSPYAKEGLFFEKYATALSGSKASKDTLLIQAPTWEVNPTIPFDYLEKEYEKDPTVFITEFGAEFTEKTTSWIERDDDLMQCVNPTLVPKPKGKPRDRHFLGFDLAPKGDRTSLVLTRLRDDKVQLAYHEEWQAGTDWYELNPHLDKPMVDYAKDLATTEVLDYEEIAGWIEEVCSRFYVVDGVYDSYEGIGFNQILQKKGLANTIKMENFSSRKDSEMFKAFKVLMYNQQIELYDYMTIDDLNSERRNEKAPYIQELLELQGTKRGKKIEVVEAPQVKGKHDDFSDALVRSIWLAFDRIMNRKSTSSHYTGGTGGGQVGGRHQKMPRSHRQYQRKKRRRHNYRSKRQK